MDNWALLHKKYGEYIGTLVIDFDKVVLFEGLVDKKDDYYYKLYDRSRGEYLLSCVGDIIPLKGIDNYEYTLQLWNFNSERKAK